MAAVLCVDGTVDGEDRRVLQVPDGNGGMVPGFVRFFASLAKKECAAIYPVPAASFARQESGERARVRGRIAERFDDAFFFGATLKLIRKLHPGVRWAVGTPSSLGGSALYGYVGRKLVAAVAEVRPGQP
jgi:hypothetical protein